MPKFELTKVDALSLRDKHATKQWRMTQKEIYLLHKKLTSDENPHGVADYHAFEAALIMMRDNMMLRASEYWAFLMTGDIDEEESVKDITVFDAEQVPNKPKPEKTPEERRMELNKETWDSPRNKLGYNKRQWKQVVECHRLIDKWVGKYFPIIAEEIITKMLTFDSAEADEILSSYEKTYRVYVKNNVLGKYPNGEDAKVRNNVFALFRSKWEVIGGKQESKE